MQEVLQAVADTAVSVSFQKNASPSNGTTSMVRKLSAILLTACRFSPVCFTSEPWVRIPRCTCVPDMHTHGWSADSQGYDSQGAASYSAFLAEKGEHLAERLSMMHRA